ncbi:hypothetical protein JCM10450v2_004917 [Rhodotorula kratochvilovae]
MLAHWLSLAATALLAAAARDDAFLAAAPPPAQLAFSAPQPHQRDLGHLVSLSWKDRDAMEQAARQFERDDADIWFAGRRRVGREQRWETVVRLQGNDGVTQEGVVDRLMEFGVDSPDEGRHIPPHALADYLSSSSLSTPYARAFSAAAVSNFSSPSAAYNSLDDSIHETYHPYEGIHDILVSLEQTYPDWVKVISLGQSSEGREIWGVKVTNQSSHASDEAVVPLDEEDEADHDEEDAGPAPLVTSSKRHKHKRHRKLGFVVAGTQHAREWIAASTILYLVHELIVPDVKGRTPHRKLLNQVEFTFVPVVNPDGYVYSWDTDRLWRKSRQPVSSSDGRDCYGIDLNRNWGFHFEPGTRPNPCSDSYPGAEAFESVELQALRDYLLDEGNHIDAFFDVHSFGQMLLFPYSYSCKVKTADEENHYEAVLQAAKALKDVHGRQFETGSVCEISLTSPGMSLDWSYASAKIRWSFGAELRDGGVFGFLLPPSQIRPSGEETSAALRSLAQFILDKEAGKR